MGGVAIDRRALPPIAARAVLPGLAVALVLSVAGASALGVLLGGLAAGRIASVGGLFQGAVVAVLWVLADALAGGAGAAVDPLSDTVATIGRDTLHLLLGAAGGLAGERLRRR